MTRKSLFICSLVILATVVSAGFFICIKNSSAIENDIMSHDGNLSNSNWTCSDCLQKESSGNYYLVASSSNFQLVSSEIDLNGFTNAEFKFKSRTYYGTTTSHYRINVSISEDNGLNWQIVTSTYSQSSNLNENFFSWGLADYLNKKIIIKLNTPGVVGRNSVGFDDLYLKVTLASVNQPPIASATSSQTTAEINEAIMFDGTDSSDSDGSITDWIWDLAGEIIHAPTITRSFTTTGTKPIYFWAVDDDLATSSAIFFNINIVDSATSTATTTPTTTVEQIINAGDLVINEIYPAPPTGEQEWLEIYNNTSSTINLSGLYLLDAKFSTTTLSGEIAAGSYLVIENISGSLNNDGDSLILRDKNIVISQTTYGDFSNKRDQSWARTTNADYAATIVLTKGTANVIEAKPIVVSGGGSSYGSTLTKTALTATSTTATSTVTSTAIDYRGKIIINEILPNPDGADEDEFIELKNISETDFELNGFYLADNTNSKHLIKSAEKLIIPSGGFVIVRRASSTIALNNSGFEAVNLFDSEGELIDRVTYEATKSEGQAYARNDNGEWLWTTTITPGEENIFNNNQAVIAAATAIISKAKTTAKKVTPVYGLVELEKIPELADGSKVVVRGVVSVEPGLLGTQIFYIAGSGLQVYCYKKDFPNLRVGDYIEISGELSTSATGRRLKMSTQADIKFLEHREAPIPHQLTVGEINEDYENSLVTVSGEVLEIKSRSIYIDDGEGELEIYVKSQINFKDLNLQPGDKLEVTGIVMKNKTAERLVPRTLADFKATKGQVRGEFEQSPNRLNLNQPSYYLGALSLFLVALVAVLWLKLRKK